MNHQEYACELNRFSYNYNKSDHVEYICNETKLRIIAGRLYYALLHHYYELFPNMALLTGPGKHESLLHVIEEERGIHEYSLFLTLKNIREWGDYRPLESIPASINIVSLLHRANSILKSEC